MTGNLPEIGSDGSILFPTMLLDNVETYLHNLAFTMNELVKDKPMECPKKLLVIGTKEEKDYSCPLLGRDFPRYSHELIKELEDDPDTTPAFIEENNLTLTKYEYKNVVIYYLQEEGASEEEGIFLSQALDQQSFVLGKDEENG